MQKQSRAQPRPFAKAGLKAVPKKRTPPPVLASEALREDLAPLEPGRATSRIYHATAAVTLLGVGVALRAGLGVMTEHPTADGVCVGAAAAMVAVALAPGGYRLRAVLGAAIGLGIMVLGLTGRGPLALFASSNGPLGDAGWRMLASILLPATLLFRAHYRAYERGRLLLFLAYLTALPFLVGEALHIVHGNQPVTQLGASITLLITLSGLFAFWGTPPVSVMAWLTQSLTLVLALDILVVGVRAPAAAGRGALSLELTAVTLAACSTIASLGLFQILAAIYARDARRINVHQPEPQLPTIRPSSGDYQ